MTKLIMIMLDAFGYTKLSKKFSPFLFQIAKKGILAKINPLLAYRGIEPTIFSGLYPDQHNIWLDYYYDPLFSPFKWTYNPFILLLNKLIKNIPSQYLRKILSVPICYTTKFIKQITQFPRSTLIPWHSLKNFNLSMNKCIIEKKSLGEVQTLFDIFRNHQLDYFFINFPFVHNDRDTMKTFRTVIANKNNFNFFLIRFFDLDTAIHKYGPNSPKIDKKIQKTDSYIQEIFKTFNQINKDCLFLIISDHGMVKIRKIFNLLAFLRPLNLKIGKDFHIFLDSTLARFYTKNKETQNEIKNQLNNLPHGHFLTPEEKNKFHIPNKDIYGDLIYVVNPGTLILPNYYQGSEIIKGMHGYIPHDQELYPLFILNGPNISPQNITHSIEFVDILPTILDLFNLTPNKPLTGNSLLKNKK